MNEFLTDSIAKKILDAISKNLGFLRVEIAHFSINWQLSFYGSSKDPQPYDLMPLPSRYDWFPFEEHEDIINANNWKKCLKLMLEKCKVGDLKTYFFNYVIMKKDTTLEELLIMLDLQEQIQKRRKDEQQHNR